MLLSQFIIWMILNNFQVCSGNTINESDPVAYMIKSPHIKNQNKELDISGRGILHKIFAKDTGKSRVGSSYTNYRGKTNESGYTAVDSSTARKPYRLAVLGCVILLAVFCILYCKNCEKRSRRKTSNVAVSTITNISPLDSKRTSTPYYPTRARPGSNSDRVTKYIRNRYDDSNNGGSVNTQDSLRQMKAGAYANPGISSHQTINNKFDNDKHQINSNDTIAHGGGTIDDNGSSRHVAGVRIRPRDPDYRLRNSHKPSRQEYRSNPVVRCCCEDKNKKRMDQHIVPVPQPQSERAAGSLRRSARQLSLSHDETLEPGYFIHV